MRLCKRSWIGKNSQIGVKTGSNSLYFSILGISLAIRGAMLVIFAEPRRLTISSREVRTLPAHVARPRALPTGAARPRHSSPLFILPFLPPSARAELSSK